MLRVLWHCAGNWTQSSHRHRVVASLATDMLQQRTSLTARPGAGCFKPSAPSIHWAPVPHGHNCQFLQCSASIVEAPSTQPPIAESSSNGLRFVWESPSQKLSFRPWHRLQRERASRAGVQPQVDIMLEGKPLQGTMIEQELQKLAEAVAVDSGPVIKEALSMKAAARPGYKLPRIASLSLVLCDDARIAALNAQHRGKEGPTDVLSFEIEDDELDYKARLPVKLLGDVVISLDTAQRQADERGHSLVDELRVLLVHGLLHLCGFDHERGAQELLEMAAAEQSIMRKLGWKGEGLISAVGAGGPQAPVDLHSAPQSQGSSEGIPPQQVRNVSTSTQPNNSPGTASSIRKRPLSGAPAGGGAGTLGVLGNVYGSAEQQQRSQPKPQQPQQQQQQQGNKQQGASKAAEQARQNTSRNTSSSSPGKADSRSVSTQQGKPGVSSGKPSAAAPPAGAPLPKQGPRQSGAGPSGRPATSAGSPPLSTHPSGGPPRRQQQQQGRQRGPPPAKALPGSSAGVGGGDSGPGSEECDIRMVALDMDGTLLNSSSQISKETVSAIKAACKRVRVVLATGKARPAAVRACQAVGLEGENLLISTRGPGVFLQGLAVHGAQGQLLSDAQLPWEVVSDAFSYVSSAFPEGSVSLVAFTGDECVTLKMTDDLKALHSVYYEPLASVAPSLRDLMAGSAVRKLLFMTTPEVVTNTLWPHWTTSLAGQAAKPVQAVPNMLEIVPQGVDKWEGTQLLLRNMGLSPAQLMAVGDGGNDYELVANAGLGVAMGNAVPRVKAVAKSIVASNDDHGVAEALERFVLSRAASTFC